MSKEREVILEELKKLSREMEENDELISEEYQTIKMHHDVLEALENGQQYLKTKYDLLVQQLIETND